MFQRFVCLSIWLMTVAVVIFLVVARCLVPHPVSFSAPDAFSNNAELSLAIELISADPVARTITMDWYPLPFGRSCTIKPGKVIDIYVDPNILDSSSLRFTSTVLSVALADYLPVQRINFTAYCQQEISVLLAFRTISKLLNSDKTAGFPGTASRSVENYPFDIYFAPMYVYALDAETREYVKLNVSHSFGQIVNFAVDLHDSREWAHWLGFSLRLKRSTATIVFVLAAALNNWLLAIAFLTICVSAVVYPSHQIYAEMFVVPVGAVFAFTAIRVGFPGAPSGFGASIDIYTILPVLIIMSFCSFFLLLIVLYRRIEVFGPAEGVVRAQSSTKSMREKLIDYWFPY
ncbi:hypothetical protein CPB83DRAFT_863762 [Crepidotus variabilis]|uniref:Transmembrane protein n=1 Tax=Crepidotus variabilis TaxID=179855 RepID=A0A9P6E5S1_9AGAR|nr:hypothetical protein CPB83DRAFT_863762 [Crepidotus variabilis]